jgi:hypothetical protein
MSPALPALSFDRTKPILFVGLAGLQLNTKSHVTEAFDAIRRFWIRECKGQRIYAVIDYTNFSLNIALTDFYAACVKTHLPSNVYATREDAIAVVKGLRASTINLPTA